MSISNFHGTYTVRNCGGSLIITLPKSTGTKAGAKFFIRTTGTDAESKQILLTPVENKNSLNVQLDIMEGK